MAVTPLSPSFGHGLREEHTRMVPMRAIQRMNSQPPQYHCFETLHYSCTPPSVFSYTVWRLILAPCRTLDAHALSIPSFCWQVQTHLSLYVELVSLLFDVSQAGLHDYLIVTLSTAAAGHQRRLIHFLYSLRDLARWTHGTLTSSRSSRGRTSI